MNQKKEVRNILIAGLVTGILGAALVLFPKIYLYCGFGVPISPNGFCRLIIDEAFLRQPLTLTRQK